MTAGGPLPGRAAGPTPTTFTGARDDDPPRDVDAVLGGYDAAALAAKRREEEDFPARAVAARG